MHSRHNTVRAVGILFLVSYGGFIIGSALLAPIRDPSSDLAAIYLNKTQAIMGVLFEFLNDAAIIGIAVLLFPFLKKHGEGLALGYVGLRIIEAATYIVSNAGTLSLITLSESYAVKGAPDAAYFQAIRAATLAEGYWAGQMATIAFISSGLLLYYLLYRSRLLPRFISVWGFIAVVLLIPANLLPSDLTQGFQPAMLMFFPIILNEIFLAIWLIAKGFDSSAVIRQTANGGRPPETIDWEAPSP